MSINEKATGKTAQEDSAKKMAEQNKVIGKAENKSVVPVAYIGPTIPGVVIANTIFSNGVGEVLKKECEKLPVIGSLIIQIKDLAQAKKQLEEKDTPINIYYTKVQQYLKEKKGE
ncbi:MAG: hypothetical protein ACLT3H_02775 [Roseburia sp.]